MNGSSKPNVLLIMADQLRADALGCSGNPVDATPNIDALAARGVSFDRVFTAYPVCAPNRGSVATGCYPSVHGLSTNGVPLPSTRPTLMETLRQNGYATYGAGKMHFGPQWRFPPDGSPLVNPGAELAVDPQPKPEALPWYGFEQVMLTEDNRVGPYGRYLERHGYDVWADPHSFTYPQHACVRSAYPEEHHQTTWIADRSIDFLEQHDVDQRPFFLWCSFVHPHHPFNPPAPYDTMYDPVDMPAPKSHADEFDRWPEAYRYKHTATQDGHEAIGMHQLAERDWKRIRAFYYGMVSLIDKQVGRLVDGLRRRGVLENTLIVFTSDHGEMLGDHGLLFKGTTFDEVTRTPLIIAHPDGAHAGQKRSVLGCTIDLMPTILDLCDIETPVSVQGGSLAPAMSDPHHALRDAVLIENGDARRSIRTADELLTWHGPGKHGELYDLRDDPDCFDNRWGCAEGREQQQRLLDQMIELMARNVDPISPQIGAC
ncbi:MAG: sulfatase [bacterium]